MDGEQAGCSRMKEGSRRCPEAKNERGNTLGKVLKYYTKSERAVRQAF